MQSPPGLRERKKIRTRAALIDAAMELCLKQGYEQTTVEQIAASADVSPRTFSRYFATKDAVFLTLLDDYAHAVAEELETVEPVGRSTGGHAAGSRGGPDARRAAGGSAG